MADSNSFITLGKLGRPHGIRGDLRIWLHNPKSKLIDEASVLQLRSPSGEERHLTVLKGRRGKDKRTLIVATQEINDRSEAEALNGWEIIWPTDQLPALEEGEFYYYRVEGCSVETAAGHPVGTVKQLIETSHPVLVIVTGDGGELLLPVLKDVVLELDCDNNRVVVADNAPERFA